jgi:hypothetical protein
MGFREVSANNVSQNTSQEIKTNARANESGERGATKCKGHMPEEKKESSYKSNIEGTPGTSSHTRK